MPRSSRHKSKRSAKDAKEYSDVEEDMVKVKQHREGKEESGSGSRYREAGSGDKRKLASTVKEAGGHGNEYSSDEYVGSKRRKEKAERVGSDRWNGSSETLAVESEVREESLHYEEKSGKSKGGSELKSKVGSGKYDVEKKEENFMGKEESRSGKEKEESKKKLERDRYDKERLDRDLTRKEAYKQKDVYEKEKGHERDDRFVDSKRDQDYRAVDIEEPKAKKGADTKVLALEDEYLKHESEKEHERRRRKREDEIGEKDRYYQDHSRDNDDTIFTSRRERDRDGRDREERHKDISSRDKHYEHFDRDNKGRDSEKRDGSDKQRVQKNDDYRDDCASKDYRDDRASKNYRDDRASKDYRDDRASKDYLTKKSDSKNTRDETDALDSRHKKIRIDNYDSGNLYDDQSSKHKDYKENGKSIDKDDYGDLRSRIGKDRQDLEKKSTGPSAREDAVSDRERSRALHSEESSLGQSRRIRSPNSKAHATREQHRYSKQPETKYRDSLSEERSRYNHTYSKEGNGSGVFDRSYSSRASDISAYREESGYADEFSSEKQRTADRRVSPVYMAEKSPSSLSAERKHSNRTGDRRSHDYEDSGLRNSSQKDLNSQLYEGKQGQDGKCEATPMDDASQADGDNMSVSSSFNRSGRTSGNSRTLLPPPSPLKHGVDNSYAIGSYEEDGRGKLNNRPKRLGDSNMGRMQGNSWRGVPNWPSPMTNGFMPYPHGPPTVGFHPMMQQFPPQMFGVRPPLDHNGVPYHIPDVDRFGGFGQTFGWPNPGDDTCPSPLPNWDSTNMVPGEGYTPGRLDWEQNRNLMSHVSRENSVDGYKGVNSGMMESPSGNQRGAKVADSADDISTSNQGSKGEAGRPHNQLNDGNNIKLEGHLSAAVSASFEEAWKGAPSSKHQAENKRSDDGDDSTRRACVYLSRIDISADLAYSDLFDQCVSLLGRKHNNMFDKEASGVISEEANAEEGSRIPCTSRAPFLAAVGDSLLEKAMSLYKQHRDEMVAIRLFSMSDGKQPLVPVSEIQGSDPMSTIDRDELGVSSQLEEEIGMMPTSPGLLSEVPASNTNEQKATGKSTLVLELAEVPSLTSFEEVDGVVDFNVLVESVNHVSTSKDDAKENKTVESPGIHVVEQNADTDIVDTTTKQSPNTAIINCVKGATEDGGSPVDASPDNHNDGDVEETVESVATGDQTKTTTLSSGSNNTTPFEGCEGGGGGIMMTELNEFGSVNLSRIH